jgi:mono/diheme cytochrome c family protein
LTKDKPRRFGPCCNDNVPNREGVAMRFTSATLAAAAILAAVSVAVHAATPAELLAGYTAEARAPASAERGQEFFSKRFGRDFANCAACHGAVPTSAGKDLVSEKTLQPLAPAAHAARFTDKNKVEHQFRVNCKDVVGRPCTAGEKADLLAWLISLKP